MSKKVLITGGAGFIGLHLANKLLKEGCHVHLVDNFSRAVDDFELKETMVRKNSDFSNIDLNDVNEVDSLDSDFEIIFHLSAIIGVTHVIEKPYKVLCDNVRMLTNIIDKAKKQKQLSRFFFASTSEVYAGTLKYFDLPIPTPENTPLAISDLGHPRTSYMLCKIYGEALCQQAGLPFTLFRPHNIYGPRMGISHVIPEQLKKAHEAKNLDEIDVFSADHTRCFCYIDDAVEMLWRMMSNNACENQTLNIGNQGPEVTIRELVKVCHSVTGKNLSINEKPASSGSPIRRSPEMGKTFELLKFESKVELNEGIFNTYEWYKKNIFDGKHISAK